MKAGETWFVAVLESNILFKYKISDLTEKTVEFEDEEYFPNKYRYKRADVEFVEKVR